MPRFAAAGILLLSAASVCAQISPALLSALEWRSIGPAATGGRIADIAVSKVPGRPTEMYVAAATGGVFKSVNEGISWTPIFDHAGGALSIGAVAVAPSNPAVVWVGTGEADNRQSSSWGDGVYKSADGGRTWMKAGLEETRHIGRIVIHPTDPNTVYVAAVGHLWGSNSERGVFKTTDGGATWKKILYKDDNTGAVDLALDPQKPEVVFAAMYQRQRKGWGFDGGGPGSGLYRTSDGGATWTELHRGLPAGEKGRIGLSTFPPDPRIVYAVVEAGAGEGGVYRSMDRGDTWEHLSGLNPRPNYYSRIVVDPKEANRVYLMGSNRGLYISEDAGRHFADIFSSVHGEDHALWVDPENTNRLVIGGDGGVSISYDRGSTWLFRLNLPLGQFYNISANNADPFLVCGGLQDNGSWCTPSATNISYGISFKEAFNIGGGDGMQAVFAGDDRTVLVSSQNGVTQRLDIPSMERQSIAPVQPAERPQPGVPGYRWYWTTPLIVSHFSPRTIFTGANVLFRSDDAGVSWQPISPDLTAKVDREKLQMMGAPVPPNALSRHDGQSGFSALTVIAESPLNRNLLYTGADDGSLQQTRDGGKHWTPLTISGLPPMLNISGIVPSKYAAGRVYVTVDGHFDDDYHPYIFVSEDYGNTWRAIVGGLPQTSVHRLREHPTNPDFLVAGLEMGAWGTWDRGAHWSSLNTNLPPVPVYDLLFQEREDALVLGTHGRGIWVLDHAEALAGMTPEVLTGRGRLFPIASVHHQVQYPGQFWFGAGEFFAPNPPLGAVLTYYLPAPAPGGVRIAIADAAGKVIRTLSGPASAGLNRTCWDLRQDPALAIGILSGGNCAAGAGARGSSAGPLVLPGRYQVSIGEMTAAVRVLPDPQFPISDADRQKRYSSVMSAYTLQQRLAPVRDAAQTLTNQIAMLRQNTPAAAEAKASMDRIGGELVRVQAQVNRALNSAAGAQYAMDGYAGLPTASQLRQLDWAWEDANGAVATLNQLIQQAAALRTSSMTMPELKPVPPLRP